MEIFVCHDKYCLDAAVSATELDQVLDQAINAIKAAPDLWQISGDGYLSHDHFGYYVPHKFVSSIRSMRHLHLHQSSMQCVVTL